MLDKLRWEWEQLREQCTNREALVNHAINGAWTGWHIHDWVWVAISRDLAKKSTFAKKAGVALQKFDQQAFAEWLRADKKELDYCRIIATSAKHFGVEIGPQIQKLETRVSAIIPGAATIDEVPNVSALTDFDSFTTTEWLAKLRIDDISILVEDLLEIVLGYWTQLMWSNDIDAD